MNKLDHLAMKHKLLDDQIDELERRHQLPDIQEEMMIADLKKERLRIKDDIVRAKIEIMEEGSL